MFMISQINYAEESTQASLHLASKHQDICDLIHEYHMATSHE